MEIKVLATGSKGNCVYISDGETPLLLDCGLTLKKLREALNFKVGEIQGVLVTHAHGDHIRGAQGVMRAGVDVYMTNDSWTAYSSEHPVHFPIHRLHYVYPKRGFGIGAWAITPFGAEHDIPTVGYRLLARPSQHKQAWGVNVLYLTDSAYCKYTFEGLTHILLGVNYDDEIAKDSPDWKYKRIMRSHMSLKNAKEFIRVNKSPALKEVHLLHLSDSNSDAEKFKLEIQKVAGVPVYIGE